MRGSIVAALLAVSSFASGAVAHAEPSVTSEQIEARETLEALFIESGVLAVIARRAFDTSGAQIWQAWSVDPGFARLEDSKLSAIHDYLTATYPSEATTDVLEHAPEVLDAFAPRFEAQLSAAELTEIRAFMRSAEGRSWFANVATQEERDYTPTAAETSAAARFEQSSGGRALVSSRMMQFIADISEQFIVPRALPIRRRVMTRVCEILEEDCPPGFTTIE